MSIQIRQTTNIPQVKSLYHRTFPSDKWYQTPEHAFWLATDQTTGKPAAFCVARRLRYESTVFLTSAGVLPTGRGRGLQKKLIQVRVNWARRQKARAVITYTLRTNYPSITNLIRCGFHFYEPDNAWVGRDVHYFIKHLNNST